jgi:hypothetical protein
MKLYLILAAASVLGCSSSSEDTASLLPTSSDGGASAEAASSEDFAAVAADFDCFNNSQWTRVGLARYKNTLGHTSEMLSAARSPSGGTFPVGTIVQLNPAEAMVKRGKGFDASSSDWEFFTLIDSDAGATLNTRGGGSSVMNPRGTCLGCHLKSDSQWDLICGDAPDGGPTTDHGCDPLPVSYAMLSAIVDPRCP